MLPLTAKDPGLIPGQRTKIPISHEVSEAKKRKKTQKQNLKNWLPKNAAPDPGRMW